MTKRLLSILLVLSMLFAYASPVLALTNNDDLHLDGYVGETSTEIIFQVSTRATGLKAEVKNIKKDRLLTVASDIKPVIQIDSSYQVCLLQFTGKHAGTCELDYSISYTLYGKKYSDSKHVVITVVNEKVEKAKEAIGQKATDVKEGFSDAASSASSKASDAWNATKEKAGDIKDAATDKASELYGKAGETLAAAKSKTAETLSRLKGKFITWYGTAKDAAIYVYDEAADLTAAGYNKATQKAKELVGDASDYINKLKNDTEEVIEFAPFDPEHPICDIIPGHEQDETDSHLLGSTDTLEQFIAYYISSVLSARGYQVYNGAVYYKDQVYGGLIYTNNEPFIQEDGKTIYSCGFMQLISSDYDGLRITDNIVQSGLIAISAPVQGSSPQPFIVEEYTLIDDFSGIFEDHYFCYKQTAPYVAEISIKDNKASNYDASIELYNFDANKYVYSPSTTSTEVETLFKENKEAFEGSVSTVNAIADLEENSNDYDDTATVIVLDGNALDQVLSLAQKGSGSVISFVKNAVRNTTLRSGQFLGVNADGSSSVFGISSNFDSARVTDGIISAVGSGLGTAGSVASIVCVCAGGVIIVKAIVITVGTMAIVYNVSNLIEGVQNVYYGSKGNSTDATNPVLLAFKKAIPDEKTAELVYHCWGIGTTILTNMLVPVNTALNIAKCKGLNTFKTCVSVARAALTYSAKLLATGVGAGLVKKYVTKVVTRATKDECMGKLIGFGSALVTGMLVYQGLDAIDKSLNVSGLYPKSEVAKAFSSARSQQLKSRYSRGRVSNAQRGEDEALVRFATDVASEELGLNTKPNIKVYYDSKGDCGYYTSIDNTIHINMRSNPTYKQLFNTVAHECRHAYQWQCIDYPETAEVPYDTIIEWAYNFSDYQTSGDSYWTQSVEVDARGYGKWFSDAIMEKFAEIVLSGSIV